MMVRYF